MSEQPNWNLRFAENAATFLNALPVGKRFTSEDLREEVIFSGIKIDMPAPVWNGAINGTLKRWMREGLVEKKSPVKSSRGKARGRLVWSYSKKETK